MDEEQMYLPGKPKYSSAKLSRISDQELRQRINRIYNVNALLIARKLWEVAERCGILEIHGFSSSVPPYRLNQLLGNELPGFCKQLDMMQGQHLGLLLLGSEDLIRERLAGLHPLQRLLQPPPQFSDNDGRVRLLLDYLECIIPPYRSTSEAFRRHLVLAGNILLLLFLMGFPFLISGRQGYHFMPIANMPYLLWLMFNGSVRRRRAIRALAIYISFTDEFMEDTGEPEEAGDGLPDHETLKLLEYADADTLRRVIHQEKQRRSTGEYDGA